MAIFEKKEKKRKDFSEMRHSWLNSQYGQYSKFLKFFFFFNNLFSFGYHVFDLPLPSLEE